MKGCLVLETGEIYSGEWHGGQARVGEVVFNTSHSGYEEIATDPSYFKQIMVSTASHQGNYGISDECWESNQIFIEGFVCLQIQKSNREKSWVDRLTKSGVPVLTDFDTRELVLRLRQGGTPLGALIPNSSPSTALEEARELFKKHRDIELDWCHLVSRKSLQDFDGAKADGPRVAVLDFGCKNNILRELQKRSSAIRVFPARTPAKDILAWQPNGILLSNGPGDPSQVKVAVQTIQDLLGKVFVYGICMGHQLLAISLGAKTYKLKFGHRGSNHPVKDDLLNAVYVTSQNHGYAVDEKTLPPGVQITHRNLNDNTVSGFYSADHKLLGIQFHPESHPGPHEAEKLFDFATEQMK